MRRPRHLSPEERALWDMVARRAKPMHDGTRNRPEPLEGLSKKPKKAPAPKEFSEIEPFQLGQKAGQTPPGHDLQPGIAQHLARAPVQMDAKQHVRMKRGKLSPEARIDLHGMTVAEAHPALVSFILGAHADGCRLVLVITGKGKDRDDGGPIPTRFGVLRHQVPQWLHLPPLRNAVLQIAPAHIRHGGNGAYYVYLRRGR